MAFPTTGQLDDFNRANDNLNTGNWSAPIFSGDLPLVISANQVASDNSGFQSSYYSASTFGADSEAWVSVPVTGGNTHSCEIFCRIASPNTASVNNYFVHVAKAGGTDSFQLWKTVSNTQTQLGSSVSQELSSTDSIGIEAIGTTIQAYYKTAAGSWGSVMSRTDSAVSAAGYIGLVIQSTTFRYDNFGGGTVVAGGASVPKFYRHLQTQGIA